MGLVCWNVGVEVGGGRGYREVREGRVGKGWLQKEWKGKTNQYSWRISERDVRV